MNKKEYWKNKPNSEKIILDLCGGTGAWSKPYADAGYNVRIITLPEIDINKTVGGIDILHFFAPDGKLVTQIWKANVYGILAAPTCTHFSLARTTAKTPRDLQGAFQLVQSCLNIIHAGIYAGTLKFWALENPMGYLRQLLGKPPLTFNPNDYAGYSKNPEQEAYTKKTDLWGFYNLPKQKKVKLTPQQARYCSINNRMLPKIPKEYTCDTNMSKQAIKRSITASGFANAFYKSNK